MTEIAAPFHTAHEALTFAFRYSGNQYTKTAMSRLMAGGTPLGSGLGLHGVDGAAQAGLILAALRYLPAEQRAVLIVRFGNVQRECPSCGRPAHSAAWLEAVDMLSHCPELADLPRSIRLKAVEKIVCRTRSISITSLAGHYAYNARTVRSRVARAKQRLVSLENQALGWLSDHFESKLLIGRDS